MMEATRRRGEDVTRVRRRAEKVARSHESDRHRPQGYKLVIESTPGRHRHDEMSTRFGFIPAILEPCVDIVPIAGRKVVLGPGRDTNEVPAVVGSEVPRPASVR